MRNSAILKWGNNNKNNKLSLGKNDKSKCLFNMDLVCGRHINDNLIAGGNNKNWIHSPETLLNGHVVYLVKVSFLLK